MELAMIGLGKMGGNMVSRLLKGGHRVVAFDVSPEAVKKAGEAGAEGVNSLKLDNVISSLTKINPDITVNRLARFFILHGKADAICRHFLVVNQQVRGQFGIETDTDAIYTADDNVVITRGKYTRFILDGYLRQILRGRGWNFRRRQTRCSSSLRGG